MGAEVRGIGVAVGVVEVRGIGVAVGVEVRGIGVAVGVEVRGIGVAVGVEVKGVWVRCGVGLRVGSGSLPHPAPTAASTARPTKAADERMVRILFWPVIGHPTGTSGAPYVRSLLSRAEGDNDSVKLRSG